MAANARNDIDGPDDELLKEGKSHGQGKDEEADYKEEFSYGSEIAHGQQTNR
jgi:hypothetical protein